jgi:hypothetical protein
MLEDMKKWLEELDIEWATWARAQSIVFWSGNPDAEVNPGPDDKTVDVHWKAPNWELLVNVPENENEPVDFYGDNNKDVKIKGRCYNKNIKSLIQILRGW